MQSPPGAGLHLENSRENIHCWYRCPIIPIKNKKGKGRGGERERLYVSKEKEKIKGKLSEVEAERCCEVPENGRNALYKY